MKVMLALMWVSLGTMFKAWNSLMNFLLNITQTGEVMSGTMLKGAEIDAQIEELELNERVVALQERIAARKAGTVPTIAP